MSEPVLNHFAIFNFGDGYWSVSPKERAEFAPVWLNELRGAAPRVEVYQVFPTRSDMDILVWSALRIESTSDLANFFEKFARAANSARRYLHSPLTLWGVTKPSIYSSGPPSEQELDPFSKERKKYLVIYPFVKTVEWYLHSRDTRKGMMNEHIRIGHKYPQISQLLLYSFGLQDQEFIVSYEAEDLIQFSELVTELRGSEARRYTERDTPIITAIHHPAEETLALWR